MIAGQTLSLVIEKPAAGGRMIARVDGQIVLVSGAIPGERVTARVEKVAKNVAYAETVAVEEPSPDRRVAFDDPRCGGCLYGHIAYARQLEIKSHVIADAFRRIGRLELTSPVAVAGSPEDGYRMRARLHVRGRRLGFFREGTHDVCDARQTRQLLPATLDTLDRLMAAARSLGVEAIQEIELAENLDASDRVVALDAIGAVDPRALDRLLATDGLTGLVSPFGVHGRAHVIDRIGLGEGVTVELRRHVLAFFQGNRHLLASLMTHVAQQVAAEGEVVDLYAGVGLFALGAAIARGVRVTAVEGDRVAAADLEANARAAGGAVVPVHQSVEEFVSSVRLQPDRAGLWPDRLTLIVDPPRTGMSRGALDGALAMRASRLVYVSCDVATLARDARRIVDAGYAVTRADAFDMFPNTPHVETVVVFDRI
ncbi:MAG: class I SAM-dependent RNA methyltransferase [Acidobacteria bacterium]|nr:class I SAM-dependent RNA methyltransferase [Acidobacteriota bacterium]